MSSWRTSGAALAFLLLAGCKSRPAQPVVDPAAAQSLAREVAYRSAILQRAARDHVSLSPEERALVEARLPSKEATRDFLRQQGRTREEYEKEAFDVALIQKMERREVFDRVAVDAAELEKAYAANPDGPAGPRTFVTAIALPGGCAETAQGKQLAGGLSDAVLPTRGHRLDLARLAREARVDASRLYALDLHVDGQGLPVALASYDRSRDPDGPAIGPALFSALGGWANRSNLLEVLPPTCIDGALWVARKMAQADARRLRFDEASDELEAPLLSERQRKAFDAYVNSVLAQTAAKPEGRP